jgi:spore coat polysaccharide biosynthesis protein SpsF
VTVIRHPAEDDIAGRLAMAMEVAAADVVVKINADCPLVDPSIVQAGLDMLERDASADGVTNKLRPSYPLGYSVEILSRRAIEWCDRNLSSPEDRELAVKWIFDHPDRFRILSLESTEDDSRLNLTLDTTADYAFISAIFDALFAEGQCFGWHDVKAFLSNCAVLPACAYREVITAA